MCAYTKQVENVQLSQAELFASKTKINFSKKKFQTEFFREIDFTKNYPTLFFIFSKLYSTVNPNKKVLSLRWKLFSLVGISLLITSELQNKALLPGLTCFFGISPKNLPYFWNTKIPYSFHIPSYFLIFSLNWASLTTSMLVLTK